MNRVLWDVDATKAAFDECADIIRRAAGSKGLKLVRDAAKVRDVTDGIREIAMSENPRNRESSVGG
jgi:hypothetical protein